jgi:dihydroxy-acid dehydratase
MTKITDNMRTYSSQVVDGVEAAPARAMLRAVGFTDDDFKKPQIGIASTWANVTPCNMHIDKLAQEAEKGANSAGGKALIFNTITVSDGIANGTEGMKYSLVSREVIADSIETVAGCEGFDAVVAVGGCDKNMPGCLIGMARLNRPAIFVYGGTIKPGSGHTDGQHAKGDINLLKVKQIEDTAIPGAGSCGGMYTANTMASAIEAMGMSLPGSSAQNAISSDKASDSFRAGQQVLELLAKDIKPRDIMTRKAFENAIRVIIALAGSTNGVLHLLAMAHAVDVKLTLDDFIEIGKTTPVLADLRPSGQYMMSDLVAIGGIQPLMKRMLDAGLLHGDALTVTGKTLAENLANVADYPAGQQIIRPFDNPIKKDSHLVILHGNLSPTGAVAKITGKEGLRFEGTARVYHGEEAALAGILNGEVVAGDVIVIRYEGPRGGPGMREMLSPTSAVMGKGLGKEVALITDGRFSGGSHGFVVGHITPEAFDGGPIALLENGDLITIDAETREINVAIDDAVMAERRSRWAQPAPLYTRGVLAKYAKLVSSASEGAVTDK